MMLSSRAASTFWPELVMRSRISSATSMDGIQIAAEAAETSTMMSSASPQVGRAAIASNVSSGFHSTVKTRARLLGLSAPVGAVGGWLGSSTIFLDRIHGIVLCPDPSDRGRVVC